MRSILLLTILSVSAFCSCSKSYDPVDGASECNSEDNPINFVFRYGVTANNILNTFDCTYQKDMVLDPPLTTDLALTRDELDSISAEMRSIGFFTYPDTFAIDPQSDTIGFVTPSLKYYFLVETDSIHKELYWDDSICNPDTSADKLRQLNDHIITIITSKEEYQLLPEPTGGYL